MAGSALPAGSFAKADEILSGGKRVALAAVEPNEPMLGSKITGPGQRATLSAMIRDGLKAVTIRVNDVDGVGGFVLPGDHVDVSLTRQIDKGNATSEVVLQNVRVLAIDQTADERLEKPSVVKAVTLEVDARRAEALARGVDRQPVADAAQGWRGQQPVHAPHHAERSFRADHAGAEQEGRDRADHRRGAPGVGARGVQRANGRIRVCGSPPMGIGSGLKYGTTGKAKTRWVGS